MTYLLLPLVVAAWNLLPPLRALRVTGAPWAVRFAAMRCFYGAYTRGLVGFLPDALAWLVVPFALLRTSWDAEHLPAWASWWGNDVSINGDAGIAWHVGPDGFGVPDPVPLEDTPEARALCYWAPGHHPRSFYARWRWLGTRNRALGLALALGRDGDPHAPIDTWPMTTGALYRQDGIYQLRTSRVVHGFELWSNQGYKLDQLLLGRKRLPAVAVAVAVRRAA